MADTNTQSGWGGFLGAGIGSLANYYGNKSATDALTGGEANAINTQSGLQGQLAGIYGPQRGLGVGADGALGAQLGLFGTPDYSAFMDSPGFKGSVALGNQAVERAASANGSLYTPNMLDQLGKNNVTYASQNYNNYIGQLMQAAGLGAQGNSGLAQGYSSVGNNISQLQQNQGNARAGGQANATGITSNLLNKVPWGSVANTVGGWFGSGSSSNPAVSGYEGSDMTNDQYNGGAFGGGAPLYDPNTGGYPGADNVGSGEFDWLNSNPS